MDNKIINFKNIKSVEEFCMEMEIKETTLNYYNYGLSKNFEKYHVKNIKKSGGGDRQLLIPHKVLRGFQKKLANELTKYIQLKYNKKNNIVHSYKKEKSIITHGKNHINKKIMISLDYKDFFPSINFFRVRGFFKNNKHFQLSDELATMLANLICYSDGLKIDKNNWNKSSQLPQGAPTSPLISNLICKGVDYKLSKIAFKNKLKYTRYADNLTFSTNINLSNAKIEKIILEIKKISNLEGFEINNDKTYVRRNYQQQRSLSIVLNKKINVTKNYYLETKAMCHSLYKSGAFVVNGRKSSINHLIGRVSYIYHLDLQNKIKNDSKKIMYDQIMKFNLLFNEKEPIIFVEGISEKRILKAALKRLILNDPNNETYKKFIEINGDNKYRYKFKIYLSKRNEKDNPKNFLKITKGGDALKVFMNNYIKDKYGFKNFCHKYPNNEIRPIILLYDNELGDDCENWGNNKNSLKPIQKTLFENRNNIKLKECYEELKNKNFYKYDKNLNICVLPNSNLDSNNIQIEDLLDEKIINGKHWNGKTLNHKGGKNTNKNEYTKNQLSIFVAQNWKNKDFEFKKFKEVFELFEKII